MCIYLHIEGVHVNSYRAIICTFLETSRAACSWTEHSALRDAIARRDGKPHSGISEVKTEVHGISLRDSTLRHQWRAPEGLGRRPCAVPLVPRRDGLPSRGPDALSQALAQDAAAAVGGAVCELAPAVRRRVVNGSLGLRHPRGKPGGRPRSHLEGRGVDVATPREMTAPEFHVSVREWAGTAPEPRRLG